MKKNGDAKSGSGKLDDPAVATESIYPISPLRVKDLPFRERPRELMDRLGAENLPDAALLALILRSGVSGVSVVELGQNLLREYGSLTAMSKASVEDLAAVRGMGRIKAQVLKSALELARRLAEESAPVHPTVRTPSEAAHLLREAARPLEREVFWALLLDTKYRLKRPPVEISSGLLDASLVHPREVFREAIRTASAAVVLVHNHPSGDPSPSAEDLRVTRQLIEAGRVVDIDVLDHIILGHRTKATGADYCSLRESGLVDFTIKGGKT
jgi:DNA repair protein RadC